MWRQNQCAADEHRVAEGSQLRSLKVLTLTALSLSQPCLQQLEVLCLGCNCYVIHHVDYEQDQEHGNVVPVPFQDADMDHDVRVPFVDADVLAIGRALKSWPLRWLHDVCSADCATGTWKMILERRGCAGERRGSLKRQNIGLAGPTR